MWRSRRWRKLLNLVDGLPRTSAFVEAIANDEEAAEAMLDRPQPDRVRGPALSEWSPEREQLDAIYDRLGELIRVAVAAAGSSPPKIPPTPRPTTAADRVRRKQARQAHNALVARVLPKSSP